MPPRGFKLTKITKEDKKREKKKFISIHRLITVNNCKFLSTIVFSVG